MSVELYANNARTTLTAPIVTTPAAGTAETWAVASSAAPLPQAITGTTQWRAVVAPVGGDSDPEIVIVTNTPDGTHVDVIRGAEGSTIKTHASSDVFTMVLTKANRSIDGTILQSPLLLAPVDLITNAPLPAFTYANGAAGVGATCTATVNGALIVDGVAVSVNQRVCMSTLGDPGGGYDVWLGIYVVTATGDGSNPWVLTRATDCDTGEILGSFWTCFSGALGNVHRHAQCIAYPYASAYAPGIFTVGQDCLDVSVQESGLFYNSQYSSAPGPGATASGFASFAAGYAAVASGSPAVALGMGSIASGPYSLAAGKNSVASGDSSVALGRKALAYEDGMTVDLGSNSLGICQSSRVLSAGDSTDATPVALSNLHTYPRLVRFVDQDGVAVWNRTIGVTARVLARRTDVPGTDSWWEMKGICRGDGTSAYTWVGGSAPTPVVLAQDAAASTWAVALTIGVDPQGGTAAALICTVTGEASKIIMWQCTLEMDEVAG